MWLLHDNFINDIIIIINFRLWVVVGVVNQPSKFGTYSVKHYRVIVKTIPLIEILGFWKFMMSCTIVLVVLLVLLGTTCLLPAGVEADNSVNIMCIVYMLKCMAAATTGYCLVRLESYLGRGFCLQQYKFLIHFYISVILLQLQY